MKFRIMGVLSAIVLILIPGCGDEPEALTNESSDELVELSVNYTIGVETGDSTETFGALTDVCRNTSGEILVLDQTICGVKVFSSDGEYIRQVGRSGSGPGEILMPLYVSGLNDGRILVHDPMSNAFVSYDSAFNYIENISLWDNGPPIQACAIAESSYAGVLLTFDMERA